MSSDSEPFHLVARRAQVRWRQTQPGLTSTWGFHGQRRYPHLLPADDWSQNLWPGSRDALMAYLDANRIQQHIASHNLVSSWVLCANLYFPFAQEAAGHSLLRGFLAHRVMPDLDVIEAVELEYAPPDTDALHPGRLLGEQGGRRGASQTSPDVAFLGRLSDGRSALILTESKFTEQSFGDCSHMRAHPPNPQPERCRSLADIVSAPDERCHQTAGLGRRYWPILAHAVDATTPARACPALGAGYQLLRQQALAEGYARSGRYGRVASCVAYDARNRTLIACLREQGITDFRTGWGPLFQGLAPFVSFSHQEWVAWVAANDHADMWQEWLAYVTVRYDFAVGADHVSA